MTKDMTTGSPLGTIVRFATPVFCGMLFQQLYNMVDTMIVGRFLGLNPLAGVGSTTSLYFLVIGSCTGICTGFGIPVAQSFGAKDEKGVRRLAVNGAYLSILISLFVAAITVVGCKPMLKLMQTPPEAFTYAYHYIVIIFAGIPCTFLYNMTASVLRALGDSRTPVLFLILSSVVNVGLDLLFILQCSMGVSGAALATIIAQGISGSICLIYIRKKFEILKLKKGEGRINSHAVWKLCSVGLPMGLQYSITAIGSIVVQRAMNGFGAVTVAGVAAAQKTNSLISCPLESLGATMATYTGQNVGAGRMDRVGRGLKAGTICAIGLSVVLFGLVNLLGHPVLRLFMEEGEQEALSLAFRYLWITTAFYPLLTIVLTVRFTIQGMGYSMFAMFAGLLEMVARCLVGFLLPSLLGFTGVCFASPFAWLCADLFLIPAFFSCRKRSILVHSARS